VATSGVYRNTTINVDPEISLIDYQPRVPLSIAGEVRGPLFRVAAGKEMTFREQYALGPARAGRRYERTGDNRAKRVRKLRHEPEKVWQALTDPAQTASLGRVAHPSPILA
jgi:hypothetical protein